VRLGILRARSRLYKEDILKRIISLLALSAFIVPVIAAQNKGAEKEVQTFVEDFLLHLGDHRFENIDSFVAPKGVVAITRFRENQWMNTYQTMEEWLAGLKKNANAPPFREPLNNVKVTIDGGHLAYLRGDYHIVREGKVQSKGVDQFTLLREPGGWKITVLAIEAMPIDPPQP
jgi:hypothetical protein